MNKNYLLVIFSLGLTILSACGGGGSGSNIVQSIIQGYVLDADTNSPIASATIKTDTGEITTSNPNGGYLLYASPGSKILTVTATGYFDSAGTDVILYPAQTININISLTRKYVLMVSIAGAGSGTVTSPDATISCGCNCAGAYHLGNVINLSAVPSASSSFSGWSGACSGTGPCSVIVNSPLGLAVTANFITTSTYPDGDLTGGCVANNGVLRALRIAAGIITPTQTDMSHGDVAPLVNGVPHPDNKIDIEDAVVIMRKFNNLVSW